MRRTLRCQRSEVAHQQQIEARGRALASIAAMVSVCHTVLPAVGSCVDETRVDQSVPLDEGLLFACWLSGPIAVELPGRALSDPARGTQALGLVQRTGQAFHATATLPNVRHPVMFALAARVSRRIWAGPSG